MIINMQSGGVVPGSIIDAQIITPGTKNQGLPAGTYLRGAQTILGDADLVPENIKKGTNIFGVIGALIEEKLPSPFTKSAIDKFTFSTRTNINGLTVNHSLGAKPVFAMLIASEQPAERYDLCAAAGLSYDHGEDGCYGRMVCGYLNSGDLLVPSSDTIEVTSEESRLKFSFYNYGSYAYFRAGIEYTLVTMA